MKSSLKWGGEGQEVREKPVPNKIILPPPPHPIQVASLCTPCQLMTLQDQQSPPWFSSLTPHIPASRSFSEFSENTTDPVIPSCF